METLAMTILQPNKRSKPVVLSRINKDLGLARSFSRTSRRTTTTEAFITGFLVGVVFVATCITTWIWWLT